MKNNNTKKNNSKNKIITILSLMFVITSIMFLTGCTTQDDDVITIGVITPLTGPASEYGLNVQKGINLAALKINEEGGVNNKKLKFVYEDSMCDPAQGISALNSLSFKNTDLFLGTVCSSVTLALGPLTDSKNILLISAASSNPEISKFDNVFRTWPSDSFQAFSLGNYFVDNFNTKSVATVHLQNDYGVGLKEAFVKVLTEEGIVISGAETIPEGIVDVRTQITKLKQLNPDVVFLAAYGRETENFLKYSEELDFRPIFIVGEAIQESNVLNAYGNNPNSFIGVRVKVQEASTKRNLFFEEYHNIYGSYPEGLAIDTAYDSVYALKYALESSETMDVQNIINALYLVEFEGVSGKIQFDQRGDPIGKEYEVITYDFDLEEFIVLE